MKIKKKTVRLHDIAVKAGVSVNTVSRALRNKPDVSEKTRTAIFRLAEELGYVLPPQSAFNDKSLTIGVLIQDILNPFYAKIAQGIERIIGALSTSGTEAKVEVGIGAVIDQAGLHSNGAGDGEVELRRCRVGNLQCPVYLISGGQELVEIRPSAPAGVEAVEHHPP